MDDHDNSYYEALALLGERYAGMASVDRTLNNRDSSLADFVEMMKRGVEDRMPLLKLNRWLGYIQGVLIERGVTTVDAERDFSRPLLRPLDFPEDV